MPDTHGVLDGRKCWIISDGKAGNDAQTVGVASALGVDITVKRVAPSGIHKLLSPWIGVASRERFGKEGSLFAPPWPDIALSIGRLTTPYIRALKRHAGERTFTVILQDPKVSLGTADLFWVPEHDRLRGPNVITTLTAPHRFTAERLETMRRAMPPDIAALPQPRVAVLLGGSNGDYLYSVGALERLAHALSALGNDGASFLITPSRRTEPAIVECVRAATERFPRIFWDRTGDNPYPHFLACADVFLAPADSVNMTGEPCATGRPVYVFHADGGSAKFARFHKALERHGATRRLPEPCKGIEQWNYRPLNSAPEIAREIARRFRLGRHAC
ncbi:mitochondrial fission ELM1 family protein [Hyphomicrobium sp.]|uniref:mitochondrial fission ELM1 family protein n=1 Tax=Hyphomicrobium sp. TaxID=82 RepID=UPI0025C149C5|nr:mitochondrial fission ELM1 family protein [Hyphomicrobium sp.]